MTTVRRSPQNARVSGPLPPPVPRSGLVSDLSGTGYREDEFFLEGVAHSYVLQGERTADGRWRVRPDAEMPFRTRILVRRPEDAARFSGTAVVEWLNVSGGLDGAPDWSMLQRRLIRGGDAWVGVSVQKAGIDGGGIVDGLHLKKADPARYGDLVHPGDSFACDIFTQAGRALTAPEGTNPLGPLRPSLLLAVGESQSASFLVTYINAIDRDVEVYDGFLVHGRGASGAPLGGMSLPRAGVDIEAGVRGLRGRPEAIRADARVPVLVLQSETDVALLGGGLVGQEDSDRIRLWEIAGAAHADTYLLGAAARDNGTLTAEGLAELLRPTSEVLGVPTGSPINSGPQQHYVANAAIVHLGRWASGGEPPPSAPRLSLTDDGAGFLTDEHGNARGGIRTPWVDAPTATLSGLGQTGAAFSLLFGRTVPFTEATLSELYPDGRSGYLRRFTERLDRAIGAGFLLAEDRDEMLALAAAS
ncbi:MAG TPA: alpha/beta hydrolase domain-containing protein [Amycolatopsis sp.]|nr:alpha/beta hydrolase domain-containing protein [Amycolatopsis sp.]